MKTQWHFKTTKHIEQTEAGMKYYRYDEQGAIEVSFTDEDGNVITATYNKDNEVTVNNHDGESYEEMYFYVLDDSCTDYLDDVIREDLESNYLEIAEQLDLYRHVPTFDDSMAGRLFCTGESIAMFGLYLVLSRGFAYDI